MIAVSGHYGYVILTGTSSIFMIMWKGMKVARARKEHNVPYPIMYTPTDDGINVFNCIQRAHQNTLENYPQFLFLLAMGGLKHPLITSAAGMVWIVGRIVYAIGYYSGKPEKRVRGAFSYLGLLTMLGCTLSSAYHLIMN